MYMRQSHMKPSTMSKLPKAHRKFIDTGLSSMFCNMSINATSVIEEDCQQITK